MHAASARTAATAAAAAQPRPWRADLDALCSDRTLDDYVLVAAATAALHGPASGPAFARSGPAEEAELLRALQPLLAPFASLDEPQTLTFQGEKLQVVHREGCDFFAVGPRRRRGVGALNTPLGVLLVAFSHPSRPQSVVAGVEAAVGRLRAA